MTTEAWDEYYKPNLTWNHAWGAAPANIVARRIAGVEPAAPGFARIAIRPQLGGLERGDLKTPTPRGPVRVAWRTEGAGLSLEISVPANTRAEIALPLPRADAVVTESGRPLEEAPGVRSLDRRSDRAVVLTGGGSYRFLIAARGAGETTDGRSAGP